MLWKVLGVLLLSAVIAGPAAAKTSLTKGYVKKSGVYVAPHFKTAPDSTRLNNFSTKGNVNPFTGKAGTVSPVKPAGSLQGGPH